MELSSEAQFHLKEFSPHRLLFLPRLNALLAADSAGRAKCIDVVTGAELNPPAVQVPSDDSGRGPPPVHFAVHPETSKLVVAAGNRLGARSSYGRSILLATILQTPVTNPQDEVCVEVPMEQVLSLLKDFQILIYVVIPELLRALRSIQVQLEKNGPMCNLKHHKCATATFTGKAQQLCDAFKELVNKLKSSIPPTSVNHARTFVMALPCLPVLSAWHAQMQLLLPETHAKVMKFESATELPTMDSKMMHIEGVRKLTLVNWPHKDYVWAVPKAMSEAGFYHLANAHSSQASITSSKGDRVSCFACKMYLYSWEPTDEPWSEHERHTGGCPYIRGEYTENVPSSTSEASHPAVYCSEKGDSVVCVSSTSTGTGLMAVGTEHGHISIWELDRGLLIMKHCEADIKIVNGVVETSTPEEDDKPSLEITETSTTATGTVSEDSAKKETTSTEETLTKKEKEASPQVTITVEVQPLSEEESKDKAGEEAPPPSLSSPPDEDEAVKSKLPSSGAGEGEKASSEETPADSVEAEDQSSQPVKKQSFHITALSILSPPPLKEEQPSIGGDSKPAVSTGSTAAAAGGSGGSTTTPAEAAAKLLLAKQSTTATSADGAAKLVSAKQSTTTSPSKQTAAAPSPLPSTSSLIISPALIGAVSITNGGQCTPTLLVYSIKSNRPIEKGKSEQKVKPPMPPPPDPLDYDPWEPIELAPSYMGAMPPSASSSVLDVLADAKSDGNMSPADLKYLHSIPLDEFSCGADSGAMPEIREILPLAGGQLLAVLCNVSSTSPLLVSSEGEGEGDEAQKGECPSNHGGILLFRTTIEEDGDRLRLRVDGEPIKVIRFSDHTSTVVSMCVITHGEDVGDEPSEKAQKESKPSKEKEKEKERDVLLGTVTRNGDVVVYDCSSLDVNAIGHYYCHSDIKSHDQESCDSSKPVECISCTFCSSTYHLAVADTSGQLTLLSVRELLLAREKLDEEEVNVEENQSYVTQPLTSTELDELLLPTCTSPDGVPYSLTLPNHWAEIHYFQLHRSSPVHLHLGEGRRVTTKVWHHQPPSMEHCRDEKYTFELVPESAITAPIGCVSVSMTFANRRCINERATVSLLAPKLEPHPSFAYYGLTWKPYDVLCGPVKLKPLIDVTGQSLQLSLFHPFLVTRRPHVLWLEFRDFFAAEYNDISVTADTSSSASKRSGWRSGGPFQHRLRQQNDPTKVKPIPLQCTIAATLHPTTGKLEALSSKSVKPALLFKLTFDPEFMSHVVLAACGYRVEEKELPTLPPSLHDLLKEGASVSTVENQFKALELLSWMVGVHLTNTNSGGYTLLSSVISQLLTSLLHACFIRGNRSLVHKCARLVVTLYRGRDDNRNDFRYSLNNALVQLLPLLPLASSASCIHFFLRLVATLTESCDSHMISRLCLTLLVELTKQLNLRSSFASQLLQTHFKHDGHIFEPELFDIYLSYCQKSTSIVKTQGKYIPGSSSYVDSEYYSILPPDAMISSGLNPLPPDWSHIDPTSSTIAAASASAAQDSSTLQVIADKGGHTIYDMELQLLLDCSKKTKAQAVKAIDEHSTFKHGSFLLFTQRGLLETLPLHYQCISVSGNASVQEANVHTLPNIPEGAPSTTSGAPVVAVSKTMGYSFPTTTANTATTSSMGGRKVDKSSSSSSTATTTSASERAQMQRMPEVLSNILVSAKELVMQIPSLKSGLAYSVVLKFPHPIYLTDISIPAAMYMSSVSVDVWLEEGGEGEAVRVAHSSEIKERSMILGNLMPAPFCQFAKVTFVGRLGANREKAQVFIGSFYGRPVFTGDTSPTPRQLLSLEENILSQYHGARDRLSQALLSYAGLSRKSSSAASQKQLKQCEEKVGSCYQECFKAQVQLARLRHFMKSQHDKEPAVSSEQGKEELTGSVFSVDEEARSLNFHEMTFSRLSKIVGCLVDALLVLNGGTYTGAEAQVSSPVRRKPFQRTISFDPEPPRFEDKIIDEFLEWSPVAPPPLSEEECSLLFLSLCIHGVPKLHARACALLTRLCGSQEWWGRFITNMALELFNVSQPGVFNKDRALLQLSILSQRTYDVSNVIQCVLQVLDEKLTQLIHHSSPHDGTSHHKVGRDSTFDHTLLQWLVLLLSHVLASIATQNQPKSHTNLFVPLPLLPSSLILSLTQPTEQIDGESRRAELAERRRDLKRMLTSLGQKIEFASAEEKIKLKEEFDAIFLEYQSLRKQLLAHHRLLRQQKSAAAAAAKKSRYSSSSQKEKDKEKEKEQQSQEDLLKPLDPDPALSSLPQNLCQSVARGLVHYIIVLTSGDSWDFLPVACKSLSQMVALTSWSYPLHSLISQEQINSLISFSCQHVTSAPSSSGKTPGSLEWGQRAVQCLLIDILHHGEIKPYFESMNKSFKGKVDVGEKPTSSPSKSAADEDKDEDKLPPHDEQELKRMGQMFDKAPLEFPQILLSCGEVEIPLNRRTWKGRKGMEVLKKQREKEKKKLQEAKEKGEGAKIAAIPEESEDGPAVKDGEATEAATEEAVSETQKVEKNTLEQEAEENQVVKVKDPESVGGISASDLKRYLRQTYLQGDFEHMVDFPPPEKHSYGLAMHNPLPPSLTPSPYLSYIISNCIDYRVLSSLEISAELELQLLAKKVYESVLHSLLHARPTPDPVAEALSGELSPEEEKGMFLESDESDPFAASTSMLTQAIEQLLQKALTPQSNLDLVSVLEFCNDLNSLLPVSSPLLPKRHKYGKDLSSKQSETSLPPRGVQLTIKNKQGMPDSDYPFTVPPVCSKEILSLLLNCLVNTQTPSSKMWQIGLSVLHTSLRYLWYFVAEKKGAIDVDYDKLLSVFVKLFSSRLDAVELREANLTQLLTDIMVIKLERGHGKGAWYGIGLLLELLISILDKRDMASLDSCLLLQLLSVISVTGHLLCLWNSDDYLHYEVIGLIKKLSVSIINLLPDILEQARHPDVVLNGGEQDEEHRRYRYIRSSGQDTKVRWIPVVSEVSHSNRIAAELIQLLREVLILPIPEVFVQPLKDFCRDHDMEGGIREDKREEREGGEGEERGDGEMVKSEKDYLKLSPHNYALLSLVYSDMPLMSTILKLLSSSTTYFDESPSPPALQKQGKSELTGAMVQNLFCNFVRFLDSHCKDHSCFFEPILEALRSTSSELRVSKTFMTVIGRLTSEFESECNQEKLINFISEGGGRLVLECLVSGCKQSSPSISRGITTQSINKLGQKDTLKPTVSGNQRINFFPHATVRLHPSRTSVKELQSSSNTEQPTRTACFNHTYQGDEEWLKMQISLPYPILLHTVQFLQPMGMFQSGPSAVFIECGTQGTLSPPTPVTSLLRTSGLPCVKIEFKQPPVASEVVIHFRSPLVSSSLALSHMQLLGTGFGTTTKSDSSSTSSTMEQSGKSGIDAHSSAGWLFIIDQWMGLSRQISDKLMSVSTTTPDVLAATLSLLQHQDTLSSKSSKQLKRLLVAMAMYSQDYGMAIVQHLLGFSPEERMAGSTSQSTVRVTTTTLDLLYQLCVPTSDENKQRLQLALRLLSNIPLTEASLSHHLPTLIRVLSSAVWEGGRTTADYDEGIFNSLAEHAFSLDVNSPMKSALNSLLCALCYCVSDFFTMLLANCSHLLEVSSEGRPKLLHTLAHVAQSVECSSILLHSDLMSGITNQLFDGFDQLLKAAKQANPESESNTTDGEEQSSSGLDVRSILSNLCTSLAFLTDFVRNWTPGKDWMALEENRTFWPLMVELFSMDMACITKVVKDTGAASSVVAFELSFCQKVVLEYFSSCLNNHTENKRAFVRLVCNSVKGAYSFDSTMTESESDSTSDSVLTPFLHNLLLELVLQPESIPIILKQTDEEKIEEPPHKQTSSGVNPLSFTPTHECLDFHPSFPIGSACYFLEMSPSSPLSKLTSQFDTPAETKPAPPKPKKDPTPSTSSSTLSSLKLPLTRKPKPPPAPPSTHSIEISNFELRKWLLPGSSFNPPQEDEASGKKFDSSTNKVVFVLPVDRERTLEEKSTLGGLLERSREVGGEDMGPALILHLQRFDLVQYLISLSENKEKQALSSTSFSSSSVESLLSLFVSERGLSSLALCLPSLYRYQWPEKTSGLALQAQIAPATGASSSNDSTTVQASKEKASLFVSQVLLHPPNILPFHSILTLGLCLRVDAFDTTLAQNLAMVYVLLRLILGTELEDLPFALSNHLSFLPYLVLLETLKTTPTNTPEGRSLRKQLLEVGVVHHTLQCLSSAGHHSPRVDSGEAEPMQMEGGSSKKFRPKITTSVDHHYWAKGTGFGTGSTTSNWNMEAINAKQKAEEKYVSLCFAILAEFLSLGTASPGEDVGVKSEAAVVKSEACEAAVVKSEAGEAKSEASESTPVISEAGEAVVEKGEAGEAVFEKSEAGGAVVEKSEASEAAVMKVPAPVDLPDYCTPELAELLSDSCLLPAMASYLLNDSVLDISKHIELYQSMLDLLSSIVVHPTLCHLLRLPVFSSDNGSAGGDETTLASLIAKLREITKIYQKTAKTKQPKAKKNMILHTHVPLSMLLTSFYTYKRPPKPSSATAGPQPPADSGKAEEVDDIQVVPVLEEAADVSKGEEKKEEDVKKPAKPDEGPDKPVEEPDKPADEAEKPVEEPAGEGEKLPDKSTDEGGKPVDQLDKAADQPEKPVEDKGEEKGDIAVPTGEAPSLPPPVVVPPRVPPRNQKPRTDVTDLAILVKKILSVSEKVARVVSVLKKQEGSYSRQASVSTPIADTAPASFDFYMKAMKPLQFDTYQILEENEYGTIRFHVPYHFQSRVQSATSSAQNAARSRRLAQEVASLSTSLPLSPSSSVFVRCDEERLDVMKVLITGPSDTPYANGCFEFDVFFPPEYPKSPMLVHMRTTGQGRVRFNPNLYNDGKVCLSVLNTWHGRPEEKWNAQNSSFLQVLVSIQSLILVPEPYFNEPGYEQYRGTPFGDQKSLAYNANIYASTVQWAMVDAIKNTSPCFKEVVLQHFYLHKSKVLAECEEWKKQLVDGISKMQESGGAVNHIKEYLRLLAKATDTLKVELDKIKPEDFRREGEEEGEEGAGTS